MRLTPEEVFNLPVGTIIYSYSFLDQQYFTDILRETNDKEVVLENVCGAGIDIVASRDELIDIYFTDGSFCSLHKEDVYPPEKTAVDAVKELLQEFDLEEVEAAVKTILKEGE